MTNKNCFLLTKKYKKTASRSRRGPSEIKKEEDQQVCFVATIQAEEHFLLWDKWADTDSI